MHKSALSSAPRKVIPRLRAAPWRNASKRPSIAASPHGLRRILVVEDDPVLREALETRLRSLGCSVSGVRDGITARWSLMTLRFDAVVMDLGLPSKGGLDVMHDVSKEGHLPPVLVLTGAGETDQELALTLGAARVMRKPSSFAEIADATVALIDG